MSFLKNILSSRPKRNALSLLESKTFCIMPWVHFHVTQYGTVTPCCQAPWQEEHAFGNINDSTIKEIWHGKKMNAFRKAMLKGITDKRCNSCFVREKSGFTSLRNITNEKYKHKHQLVSDTSSNGVMKGSLPVYLDIRFSNVCNLRCRICGPWSSSSWHNDAVKLGMASKDSNALTYSFNTNSDNFFKQFTELIPYLEELYFAGGEPIVMDEHYKLLNLLIQHDRTSVKLTYNTNFSSFQYKENNVVQLWKYFKNISVAASLDGSGARGEFLRKNLKWQTVLENRKQLLKELPQVEFIVSATLNVYNVFHLPDFHKEWVGEGLIQVEDFIPTLLVNPPYWSINVLPLTLKQKAIRLYKEHLNWIAAMNFKNEVKRNYMVQQFENIVKALSSGEESVELEKFKQNALAIDAVRNEMTVTIFPELKELFE